MANIQEKPKVNQLNITTHNGLELEDTLRTGTRQ